MARYHISKNGTPAICHAEKGKCPLGGADGMQNHFDTKAEALAAIDNEEENEFMNGKDLGFEGFETVDKEVDQGLDNYINDWADTYRARKASEGVSKHVSNPQHIINVVVNARTVKLAAEYAEALKITSIRDLLNNKRTAKFAGIDIDDPGVASRLDEIADKLKNQGVKNPTMRDYYNAENENGWNKKLDDMKSWVDDTTQFKPTFKRPPRTKLGAMLQKRTAESTWDANPETEAYRDEGWKHFTRNLYDKE